jgi:hypothetical protein
MDYNKKKRLAITLAILFIIAVITSIVLAIIDANTNPYGPSIEIQNYDTHAKDLPTDTKRSINRELYLIANANSDPSSNLTTIKDALIRDDSLSETYHESENYHSGSFIVDIASIKQSYAISYAWSSDPTNSYLADGSATALCIRNPSLLIYDQPTCKNTTILDDEDQDPIIKYLPYSHQTNQGPEFTVYLVKSNNLEVALNACDSLNKGIFKANFLNWFTTTGLDMSNYQITYVTPCD